MQELQLLCDGWGKGSPTKGLVRVWMASYGAPGLGLDSGKDSGLPARKVSWLLLHLYLSSERTSTSRSWTCFSHGLSKTPRILTA